MAFNTGWESEYSAPEVMNIIKRNGAQLRNIDDNVSYEINRLGEYEIIADSDPGITHTSKMRISVKPNPNKKGSIIDVQPGPNCSASEAQELEDKIKEAYFGDGRII